MSFKKLALFGMYLILFSLIIAFATDLMVVTSFFDDVRVQTYIGGFHVAGMAADPTALAHGPGYTGDLYLDDDIYAAFEEFSKASFGGMSDKEPDIRDSGGARHVRHKINKMLLRDIITSCEIITSGGAKGVALTVEYQVEPRLSMLLGEGFMPDFMVYRLRITRKFRLMGQ